MNGLIGLSLTWTKRIELQVSEILVDDEDQEILSRYNWSIKYDRSRKPTGVRARVEGREVSLHRHLLNAPLGTLVDHKNGNPLDNRRNNIRFATTTENGRNRGKHAASSSRFKGVKRTKTGWLARIAIGTFLTEEEAARAYDREAQHLFGEFARLNFPLNDYPDTWIKINPRIAVRPVGKPERYALHNGQWYQRDPGDETNAA